MAEKTEIEANAATEEIQGYGSFKAGSSKSGSGFRPGGFGMVSIRPLPTDLVVATK
jgi:hypothetical protein